MIQPSFLSHTTLSTSLFITTNPLELHSDLKIRIIFQYCSLLLCYHISGGLLILGGNRKMFSLSLNGMYHSLNPAAVLTQ